MCGRFTATFEFREIKIRWNQDLVVSLLRKILRTILNKSWGERSSESRNPLAPGIFACASAQSS